MLRSHQFRVHPFLVTATPRPRTCLFACDLDRTLLYSPTATRVLGPRSVGVGRLTCVETLAGRPISFVAAAVPALVHRLSTMATFVPVTTRTMAQFSRVRLFSGPDQLEWAVCSSGGNIVHNGERDIGWHRLVKERADATGLRPDDVVARMVALGGWVERALVADDLFVYALIDVAEVDAAAVSDLASWLHEHRWVLSRQGRKLYALPDPVDKWTAVAAIAERTGCALIGAAGDSLLDLTLLDEADSSLRPPHGELHHRNHPVDLVVAVAGVEAGAAVLTAAAAWVAAEGSL